MGYVNASMWVLFAASVALTTLIGLILAYHWIAHAHNAMITTVAIVVYSSVSFILLSTLFGVLVSLP